MNEKRKSLRISFEYQDLFMHHLTKTCDIIGITKVKYKKVLSLHTYMLSEKNLYLKTNRVGILLLHYNNIYI